MTTSFSFFPLLPLQAVQTMRALCMRSAPLLLLHLLLLFFSAHLLLPSPFLAPGVCTVSASSIAAFEGGPRHGKIQLQQQQQLLLRWTPRSALSLPLQPFPPSALLRPYYESKEEKGGKEEQGHQRQVVAFLGAGGASAGGQFNSALRRHSISPLYNAARGVHTPHYGEATAAGRRIQRLNCKGRGIDRGWHYGDEPLPHRCLYTGRKSGSLFAGGGAALAQIPLSKKQLARLEQVEQQPAQVSKAEEEAEVEDKEEAKKRRERLKDWRVVLHNDDIHTFECVENAITKILPHISRARAYDIALHAHTTSKATIMLTWEEKATEVALALQEEGLTVSVLPDNLFSKEDEEDKEEEEK